MMTRAATEAAAGSAELPAAEQHAALGRGLPVDSVEATPGSGAPGVSPELEKAFHRYDRNGDGSIDASELEAAFADLGMPTDPTAVASLIASCSVSGRLSLPEFAGMVSMLHLARPQRPLQLLAI